MCWWVIWSFYIMAGGLIASYVVPGNLQVGDLVVLCTGGRLQIGQFIMFPKIFQ